VTEKGKTAALEGGHPVTHESKPAEGFSNMLSSNCLLRVKGSVVKREFSNFTLTKTLDHLTVGDQCRARGQKEGLSLEAAFLCRWSFQYGGLLPVSGLRVAING
jgi:hypothetical protein